MASVDLKTEAEALRREHAVLGREMGQLKISLATEFDWGELDQRLGRLQEVVYRHFEFEENGGYMVEVTKLFPNRQSAVDALYDEHQGMRRQLESVRQFCRETEDRVAVRQRVSEFFQMIHQHEDRENALVQSTFNRDIGNKD